MFADRKAGWLKAREDDKKIQTKSQVEESVLKKDLEKRKADAGSDRSSGRRDDDYNSNQKGGRYNDDKRRDSKPD
jgi:hypothetical protein